MSSRGMKPSGSSPSYGCPGSWTLQFGVTRQKLSQRPGHGRRSRNVRRVALTAIVLLAAVPATARADGLPAVGIDAHPLALPDGDVAYITRAGAHSTRLIEHARYGGPLRERLLRGSFSIPAVAYDGSPSGLSP